MTGIIKVMANIEDLESRLTAIEARNKSVAADKAWEVSLTRRIIVVGLSYLAIGIYFNVINIDRPWLNAIVPALAFYLSTLTIPAVKKFWLEKIYKKQ